MSLHIAQEMERQVNAAIRDRLGTAPAGAVTTQGTDGSCQFRARPQGDEQAGDIGACYFPIGSTCG
jgi:hypothetical protein